MDERKIKVLQLYALGVPIRRIARILGIPKSTVERWVKEPLTLKAEEKQKKALLQDEIWDRVLELLKLSNEEKGRTRVLSVSQIYRLFEMELQMRGIKSERTFRRRLEEVIKERFGSWEKLELSRRNKDEIAEYRKSKKKQRRQPAEWEIDATAYSHKNEMFFILAARERWSGYFLSCMIAKAREDTNTLYYNKAFNSADLAKFLMSLFQEYGIPSRIITDNEQFLKATLIERGLKTLGIQVVRTKPYNPSAKLIERSFRDLKALLRYYVNTHATFEEALTSAVEVYNRSAHRFEHFNEPVIPEILHSQVEYRQVSEDRLRRAFMERFERVVRNNTIVIENLRYEFILPTEERFGEIGRNRRAPVVVCYRDLENITLLEVWDEKETRPLGIARLISQDVPSLDPTEIRELRNKERRIERRKRKLKKELVEIEQQELQLIQQPTTTTLTFLEFLSAEQSLQPTPQPQPEEEKWDSINIWLGGNSHDAR